MLDPNQITTLEQTDDLIMFIETLKDQHSVFILQCENITEQREHIARYQILLSPNIAKYCVKIQIDSPTPNLYLAVSDLIAQTDYLQQHGASVITVIGTEHLKADARKMFIANLEFKMTQLQRLPFAILLWVNRELLLEIAQKAPTFYECAKGIFRF
jgi:hypothetical protein